MLVSRHRSRAAVPIPLGRQATWQLSCSIEVRHRGRGVWFPCRQGAEEYFA